MFYRNAQRNIMNLNIETFVTYFTHMKHDISNFYRLNERFLYNKILQFGQCTLKIVLLLKFHANFINNWALKA